MIKVMFVCHGNICRSPMAEFLLKDAVKKLGKEKEFFVASSATSSEEIESPVHYGTKRILDRLGISSSEKRAVRLNSADADKYDYFVGMDEANVRNMRRILGERAGGKIFLLMEFTGKRKDVADPWYTGNFEETYRDISEGIDGFLKTVL